MLDSAGRWVGHRGSESSLLSYLRFGCCQGNGAGAKQCPGTAAREARGAQSLAGAARDWRSPPLHPTQPVVSLWVPLKKGPLTPCQGLWDGQEKLGAKGFILALVSQEEIYFFKSV